MNITIRSMCAATVALTLLALGNPVSAEASVNGYVDFDPSVDGPVTVGGGWVYMSWWGAGKAVPIDQNPFTYSSAVLTVIRVTDAFCYGDQFSVSDNGEELGTTSEPGSSACGGPGNGDAAYADPDMSSGCWLVMPGDHSIEIFAIQNPFGSGGGFMRVDEAALSLDLLDCITLPI